MTQDNTKEALEAAIIQTLKGIYDPEVPVDIYELGLIYKIDISNDHNVKVLMTLTAPNCPVAESLPLEVKEKVAATEGVKEAKVELTFEPPWDKDMMSDEALLELGFL